MKFLILLVALFALAYADESRINKQELEVQPDSWNYHTELTDGTNAEQVGHLENAGSEHEAISVKGSYEHIGPDGVKYTVHYVADEHGFQPTGDHIPKAQ